MSVKINSYHALRIGDVIHKTGISRAQIYRLVQSGEFPSPYALTETGRIKAWNAAEVDAWLASKFREAS